MTTKNRHHKQAKLNKMCSKCDVSADCIDEIKWYCDTVASITGSVTTVGGAVLAGVGTYALLPETPVTPVAAAMFAFPAGIIGYLASNDILAPKVKSFCCNVILARRQKECAKDENLDCHTL